MIRFPATLEGGYTASREWIMMKEGGAMVARLQALATVRVQKGHIRVHRDILP